MSLSPKEEENAWIAAFRGGGSKRSRDENDDEQEMEQQPIRRARSEESNPEEAPCPKMARLPSSSSPSLSSSLKDAVQFAMTNELKTCGLVSRQPETPQDGSLLLAPCLVEYCAFPSRYLPRPEWVAPVQRTRPRVESSYHHAVVASAHNNNSTVLVRAAPNDDAAAAVQQDDAAIAAVQQEENGQDGTNHNNSTAAAAAAAAPNDGLLPDHLFHAFSSEAQRVRVMRPTETVPPTEPQANNGNHATTTTTTTAATTTTSTTTSVDFPAVNNKNNSAAKEPPVTVSNDAATAKTTAPPPPPLLAVFGKDHDTALHYAIREGATEAALDLLNHGASVHAENSKGVTPLVLASQKGQVAVAALLLQKGASPLAASVTGCTSLLQAAHFGRTEVVRLLLQHGARMELANYKNTTPLMRAAQEGHEDIVQILVENGAMVNRRNNEQMTSLMLASQRGHARVVQRLADAGAKLNATTAQDSTSLMLACKRGHARVVEVLVASGCELQLRDSRGRTARDMAQRKNSKELLRLLHHTMQTELMRRASRKQRNHVVIQMYWLLQQERATVPIERGDDDCCGTNMTIHQLSQHPRQDLVLSRMGRATRALVRAMALPAPLLQHICTFMPLPHLWNKRMELIDKRCRIDADSAVSCSLDVIDEVLEEGGFVQACDVAGVTPPPHFKSWGEWKSWGKRFDGIHGSPPSDQTVDGPSAINSTLSALLRNDDVTAAAAAASRCNDLQQNNNNNQSIINPQQGDHHCQTTTTTTTRTTNDRPPRASSVELRRDVCFLQLLAYRSPLLTRTLASPPYNMTSSLIQKLKNVNDIQSLVRRMGSTGVHFDVTVALELVWLAFEVVNWYSKEREDR